VSVTYTYSESGDTLTPRGVLSAMLWALPVMHCPCRAVSDPISVEMMPPGDTSRTAWLNVSAMTHAPVVRTTATSLGWFNEAKRGGPPSPA